MQVGPIEVWKGPDYIYDDDDSDDDSDDDDYSDDVEEEDKVLVDNDGSESQLSTVHKEAEEFEDITRNVKVNNRYNLILSRHLDNCNDGILDAEKIEIVIGQHGYNEDIRRYVLGKLASKISS